MKTYYIILIILGIYSIIVHAFVVAPTTSFWVFMPISASLGVMIALAINELRRQ